MNEDVQETLAGKYAPYLLHLLENTRLWMRRQVVNVEFLDLETMRVAVGLDIDLTEDRLCREYALVTNGPGIGGKRLPNLILPLGLQQIGFASFSAVDYQGHHLVLLTTDQSASLRSAIELVEKTAHRISRQLNESPLFTFISLPEDYTQRHDLRYSYLGPFGVSSKKGGNGSHILKPHGRRKDISRNHNEHHSANETPDSGTPAAQSQGSEFEGEQTSKSHGRHKDMSRSPSKPKATDETAAPKYRAGQPRTIEFDLLHAEAAESYHFEVHVPPGTVVYDRDVEGVPKYKDARHDQLPEAKQPKHSSVIEVPSLLRGEAWGGLNSMWALPPSPEEPSEEQREIRTWNPAEHASLYLQYDKIIPPRELTSSIRFRIWIGIDPALFIRPLLLSGGSTLVLVVTSLILLYRYSDNPYPWAGSAYPWAVPAAIFQALNTAFLGFISIPGTHAVTDLLYRPVRWAVLFAGAVAFFGFLLAMAEGVMEQTWGTLFTLVLSCALTILALTASYRLTLLWWRASETGAKRFIDKPREGTSPLVDRPIG